MLRTVRRGLSLILILVSSSLLVWAAIPNQHMTYTQTIGAAEMQPPDGGKNRTPTSMESRQVRLEWPSGMRIGDTEQMVLRFEPVESEADAPGNQPGVNTIYDHYNLMAEGRLETVGFRVEPAEARRESMPDGQKVSIKWQISSERTGTYDGTVWLSLRYLPLDGSKASQAPIFIKPISIQVNSLLGLSRGTTSLVGGVGVVLAGMVAYGDIMELGRKWIKRKDRKLTNNQ